MTDEIREREKINITSAFPRETHERIVEMSRKEHRSIGAQVVQLVEEAIAARNATH